MAKIVTILQQIQENPKNEAFICLLLLALCTWRSAFRAVLGVSCEGESVPWYNKSLSHLSNSPSPREKNKDGGRGTG